MSTFDFNNAHNDEQVNWFRKKNFEI